MVFYPSENNSNRPGGSNPVLPAFDLRAEKQRIGEGLEEIRQELLDAWQKKYGKAQIFPNKLSSTNTELIEFLLSFKNTLFYNDAAKKFGLSPEQRDLLPQLIWNISLAKNWYGIEGLLQSEMKMNPATAGQIATLLNQNILFKAKELGEKTAVPRRFVEEKIESGMEKIPIQVALKRYAEVGEQLITSERITLKSFPGPVRPSIKNWLADYNFIMGYGKERTAIERTTYLFHNPNTQKLNSAERERVSYIFKSFDENSPITVNKNTKQVIFPAMVPKPTPPATPQPTRSTAPNPPAQPAPVFRPAAQSVPKPVFQTPRPAAVQASPAPKPSTPPQPAKPEWKDPAALSKKEDGNVRFTSPHTLPVEKDQRGPLQPHRITPSGLITKESSQEKDFKSAKNVINLKE